MLNPDVFCGDITISLKILAPYNAFKGNTSKKHSGPEIFLNPYVLVCNSSKLNSPGRIDPNFLKIKNYQINA
jgi:hypothetical protein